MSAWDNATPPPSGNFAKWVNPGDNVTGIVTLVDPTGGTTAPPESKVCPLLGVDTDDGETIQVTCSQYQLHTKVFEAAPEVGDRIAITYTGQERMPNGNTPKQFTVEVTRAGANAPAGSML